MSSSYTHYIDGRFVEPRGVRHVRRHQPGDPGGARARARRGAGRGRRRGRRRQARVRRTGRGRPPTAQERGRILLKLAGIVREHEAELAELETNNTGKPIAEAEYDIADVATCFEYYGGLATKIHGDVVPVPDNALSLAHQGADRRRRADHPLELPADDGGVEAGAGHLRRLHDGAEAGRADAAHGARAGELFRGRRPAARRREHRDGAGRDRRAADGAQRTSTRSPSPAAPRSARSSCGRRPTR